MTDLQMIEVSPASLRTAGSLLMRPVSSLEDEVAPADLPSPSSASQLLDQQQQQQHEHPQQQQQQGAQTMPGWKVRAIRNGFMKPAKQRGAVAPIAEPDTQLTRTARNCLKASVLLKHAAALALVAVGVLACLAWGHNSFRSNVSADTSQRHGQVSAPLKTLTKPLVILISLDGFRWGYNFKVDTPNIDRIRVNGTEAEKGLFPVFPTLTFPNHYSIVTGLYPAWHGIIANYFRDLDPDSDDFFYQGNLDPKWWLGEPIWETCAKNGLPAATYFWPGSEVVKGSWTCPPAFCKHYNESVPFEERVDTVLSFIDLPPDDRPSFISLYFDEPDHPGHSVGPDGPEIDAAVTRLDGVIGRLLDGLEKRNVSEDTNIILVGDHGMVGNCESRVIQLEDLEPCVEIPQRWLDNTSPLLAIVPPPEVDVKSVYRNLTLALQFKNVENAQHLKVYLKDELPEKYHLSSSDRVWPIVGVADEGYTIEKKRPSNLCGGSHGYDNDLLSMRTIFIASGPRFAKGRKVPSFVNIEIYNVLTSILNITAAPNNGTPSFADSLLLPLA